MHIADRLLAALDRISAPATVRAHCDLPCGVYDPAQARIEAESVKNCITKFNESSDDVFKTRATFIKEERADLVKHHLWVLWTDYFKPEHLRSAPAAPRPVLEGYEDRGRGEEGQRPGSRRPSARLDQGDRHDLLGDQESLITQKGLQKPDNSVIRPDHQFGDGGR